MTTQERWKHVAEVAAWMADGKTVQLGIEDGIWDDVLQPIPNQIVCSGWKYRVKPGPVECICTIGDHQGNNKAVLDAGLKKGDRVRVTKLDDQSSTSPL